jgi:endonuclease/exonuclease/phosphatase family metal-dependent hydrolase
MQFGQGWDDAAPDRVTPDLGATLEEIKRHNADLILLQEVEHAQDGGGQIDPPPNFSRLKAGLAGYDSWFAYPKEDSRELPFGIGLAIFSRTPLADKVRIDIPSPPIEFDFYGRKTTPTDRVMIGARTTLEGHKVQIYNVHLLAFFMLGSSHSVHHEQVDLVAGRLDASKIPTILGGDFNVRNHEDLMSTLAPHGYHTVQHEQTTWRRRPYVLDHIFHNGALQCVRKAVEPTKASDHHALVADFEFA